MRVSMHTTHGYPPLFRQLTHGETHASWGRTCWRQSHTTHCAPWQHMGMSPADAAAQTAVLGAFSDGSSNRVPPARMHGNTGMACQGSLKQTNGTWTAIAPCCSHRYLTATTAAGVLFLRPPIGGASGQGCTPPPG